MTPMATTATTVRARFCQGVIGFDCTSLESPGPQKAQRCHRCSSPSHTRAAEGAELPRHSSTTDESAVLEFRGAEINQKSHLQFRRCEIAKDLCVVCRACAGACLNLDHDFVVADEVDVVFPA